MKYRMKPYFDNLPWQSRYKFKKKHFKSFLIDQITMQGSYVLIFVRSNFGYCKLLGTKENLGFKFVTIVSQFCGISLKSMEHQLNSTKYRTRVFCTYLHLEVIVALRRRNADTAGQQSCQTYDFIQRSWEFFSLMGFSLGFNFSKRNLG